MDQRTRHVTAARGALARHDGLAYRWAARKFSGGTMAVAFPGESAEYRAARNRLLDQEIELRRGMEAVADAKRRLPPRRGVPEDYALPEQAAGGRPAPG